MSDGSIMLEISAAAQPSAMVEPENVTLTFTLSNTTAVPAENVYLSSLDGLLYERIGTIAPGDTQTITRTHSVTESELNSGSITYVISHDDIANADGRINYTISAPIQKTEAAPGVEFTRQVSSAAIYPGDTLMLTYRVYNTGNVALTQLRVEDALGTFSARIDRLDVGESRTLINRVTPSEAVTSMASLSYCVGANENDIRTRTLAELVIPQAQPALNADISAEYTSLSGDAARITLQLANEGNVDYPNLTVTDANGAIIADHVSIPVGMRDTLTHACPINGKTEIIWHIAGTDACGGAVDVYTEPLVLVPADMGAVSELNITAAALTPNIRTSGDVAIEIHIENTGGADINDVVLSEAQAGEIKTFAVVPGNGSIDRILTQTVTENSEYTYTISYSDSDGWQRTASADPVRVEISADGVQPEGTKRSFIEFTGTSVKVGGSTLFAWLLIAACAVLIVLIVILIVASRRARIEKQIRIAAEKQRRSKRSAPRTARARKG